MAVMGRLENLTSINNVPTVPASKLFTFVVGEISKKIANRVKNKVILSAMRSVGRT